MRIAPTLLATFLLGALLPVAPTAAAACSGPDPALSAVKVASVSTDGRGLNHYTIKVVVTNAGTAGQTAKVLQSVNVSHFDVKVDTKGIPPLRAGASYVWMYHFVRNAGAGKGTTTLQFALDMHGNTGANCSTSNDNYNLTF
ncbi:MAG: hypothetical protein ABI346_03190 [Candidatus Baltobacteraceae bacterium]